MKQMRLIYLSNMGKTREEKKKKVHRTHLVEFDNVGVIQHFHDLNLPVDLLQVYCI